MSRTAARARRALLFEKHDGERLDCFVWAPTHAHHQTTQRGCTVTEYHQHRAPPARAALEELLQPKMSQRLLSLCLTSRAASHVAPPWPRRSPPPPSQPSASVSHASKLTQYGRLTQGQCMNQRRAWPRRPCRLPPTAATAVTPAARAAVEIASLLVLGSAHQLTPPMSPPLAAAHCRACGRLAPGPSRSSA